MTYLLYNFKMKEQFTKRKLSRDIIELIDIKKLNIVDV